MKMLEQRIEEQRHSRLEADLEATTSALFSRWPTLCGFAIRDATILCRDRHAIKHLSGLFVTEISVFPLSGLEAPGEISSEIVAALVALIDECPEASALLRERSFARTFH